MVFFPEGAGYESKAAGDTTPSRVEDIHIYYHAHLGKTAYIKVNLPFLCGSLFNPY